VPLPVSARDWAVGLIALTLAGWIAWRLWQKARQKREIMPFVYQRGRALPLAIAVGFIVTIGPVSNVVLPIGATFANRLFYLPLMALAFVPAAIAGPARLLMLPGAAYAGCLLRTIGWGVVLVVSTITSYFLLSNVAVETHTEARPTGVFHPEEPYWRLAVDRVPSSAKAQLNVGVFALSAGGWYAERKTWDRARAALDEADQRFAEALRLDGFLEGRIVPRQADILFARALIATKSGDAAEATRCRGEALKLARDFRDRALQELIPGANAGTTQREYVLRESERLLARANAEAAGR
jgi:tetratricopeptide (TPR) repeat protein